MDLCEARLISRVAAWEWEGCSGAASVAMHSPEGWSYYLCAQCAARFATLGWDRGGRPVNERPGGSERGGRLELGRVEVTPAAAAALALDPAGGDEGWAELLGRHATGDWGDVDAGDARANDRAMVAGLPVQSCHRLPGGAQVWIVTDGERATTVVMRPTEYPPGPT